jgi:hypothetical protein
MEAAKIAKRQRKLVEIAVVLLGSGRPRKAQEVLEEPRKA